MKKMNSMARSFLVGALALAITGIVASAKAESIDQVITVLKVKGAARYSVDNKTWQTIHKGDVLKQGAVIQTAEESSVDLGTSDSATSSLGAQPVSSSLPPSASWSYGGDGLSATSGAGSQPNILHVFESSVVSIDKLTAERTGVDVVSDTQIDLRAGRILGDVKKLSAASRYEVKIPNGVAGIRGTTYTVAANGTVYCLSGSVIISYVYTDGSGPHTATVTVPAGQSFNPFLNGGVLTPTAGAGTQATIPPATLAALNSLPASAKPTTPGTYTKNGTSVFISPQ
jgi:hypothetical protein